MSNAWSAVSKACLRFKREAVQYFPLSVAAITSSVTEVRAVLCLALKPDW